jgi:hypothetical protein
MSDLINRLKSDPRVVVERITYTNQGAYTANNVAQALQKAGYEPEDIKEFMAERNVWRAAWEDFQNRALAYISMQRVVSAMGIINDMREAAKIKKIGPYRLNNNWQPFFAAIFNDKYNMKYFESRRKNNKSPHNQERLAA